MTARLHARAPSRATLRWLAALISLLLVIGLAGVEIDRHMTAAESWITHLGRWSVPAFIGLFVVAASILVPDTVLCVVAGALFGLWYGTAAVMAGSLLAGAAQYGLSRRLLRARIQQIVAARPALAAIQRGVMHDELRVQLLLRLAPLNPSVISYLLGAAGVRFSGFLIACLALTPHLLLEVYSGHAGRHIVRMSGVAGATYVHGVAIAGGLAFVVVVVVLLSRTAERALKSALEDVEKGGSASPPV